MPEFFKDLSSIRMDPLDTAPGFTQVLAKVPVRKPGKQEWFQVTKDPNLILTTLVFKDELDRDEVYFIDPGMRAVLADEARLVQLTPCITRENNVIIWPIGIPDPGGKRNGWIDSAHAAARHAQGNWIRLKSDQQLGVYNIITAPAERSNPVWPDKTLNELLEIAFAGRVIDNEDHTIVRRLKGFE
ncbi:hypothetical protein MMSR116_18290 [Methylobacterium mesophilicum SR1.6/6]|uniref:Uncharacterized protein n=1 Tax=Methylobacterium mesophilicum SR1.6/6 TaxID=908290 RepID=A0A6B9FM20_9HYPH|nr:hypothetical protein [Methylobacterium mesophilicum]QGY03620.1 hypothetical protein MMSR116_18290 [Methylobacterium mesophilicum SR1.6/6]